MEPHSFTTGFTTAHESVQITGGDTGPLKTPWKSHGFHVENSGGLGYLTGSLCAGAPAPGLVAGC